MPIFTRARDRKSARTFKYEPVNRHEENRRKNPENFRNKAPFFDGKSDRDAVRTPLECKRLIKTDKCTSSCILSFSHAERRRLPAAICPRIVFACEKGFHGCRRKRHRAHVLCDGTKRGLLCKNADLNEFFCFEEKNRIH